MHCVDYYQVCVCVHFMDLLIFPLDLVYLYIRPVNFAQILYFETINFFSHSCFHVIFYEEYFTVICDLSQRLSNKLLNEILSKVSETVRKICVNNKNLTFNDIRTNKTYI